VLPLGRDSNNYVGLVQLKKTNLVEDAHHDLPEASSAAWHTQAPFFCRQDRRTDF
jgi:hypothetical protein